jgi:hypothetical protein
VNRAKVSLVDKQVSLDGGRARLKFRAVGENGQEIGDRQRTSEARASKRSVTGVAMQATIQGQQQGSQQV